MTFDEIVTEVCTRVNDPDKDTYGGRAETLFIQAVCELAIDSPLEEIQELIIDGIPLIDVDDEGTSMTAVEFLNYEASFSIPYGTLKVLDLFIDPADLVVSDLILKEIDHDEVKRMKLEPAFKPAGNECFWYRIGNEIRLLLSEDWTGGLIINFTFQIINSPDKDNWTGDMTTGHGYSKGFVFKCIENAVGKLRAELV